MPAEAHPHAPVAPGMAAPGATPPDWAAETAGRIEDAVGKIRAATVDRLASLARLVVYGLLAAIMGITALVLFTIAAVRALDVWIPRGVWLPDLLLGTTFVLAGLMLWSRRTARSRGGRR